MAFPLSNSASPARDLMLSPAGHRCSPQSFKIYGPIQANGCRHSDLRHAALGGTETNVRLSFVSSFRGACQTFTRGPQSDAYFLKTGTLHVRAAGRSKAAPKARPKPSQKWQRRLEKRPGGVHKTNLHRRGRRVTLDPNESARKLLESPQLSAEALPWPLLAACLSPVPLTRVDEDWIEENIDEVKEALGLLGGPDGWGEEEEESEYDSQLGSYTNDGAHSDGSYESEDKEESEDVERGRDEAMLAKEDGSEFEREREREGDGRLLAEERGWSNEQVSDSDVEEVEEGNGERDGRWRHLDHLLYLAMMHR